MERWAEISELYVGYYLVSSYGRIKSVERFRKGPRGLTRVRERILKPKVDKYGYCCVTLSKDAVSASFTIHRLVAKSFIPNPEGKAEVNHIDHNKLNNNIENLEWMNRKEQIKHDRSTILKDYKGERHVLAKLTDDSIRSIRELYKTGKKQSEIAKRFNVTQAQISNIILNRQWTHV